jgi:hypothetical protein
MGVQDRDYMKESGPAERRKTQPGSSPEMGNTFINAEIFTMHFPMVI